MPPGLIAFLLFEVALLVVGIVAGVKIIIKAGYSGWWFLVFLLPLVGFIMFVVFAFAKWPLQQRLEQAERNLLARPPSTFPGGDPGVAAGWGGRASAQSWAQPLPRPVTSASVRGWDGIH